MEDMGIGLQIHSGASAEVTHTVFTNNRNVGVFAADEETTLTMSDILISHTLERQCATDEREEAQPTCEGFGSGSGIVSIGGAHIEMNRFVISKNALCGVQLAFGCMSSGIDYELGGTLNISNGLITNNDICGINVQTKGIEISDLNDTVLYDENNYNNLDTAYLPTPGGF